MNNSEELIAGPGSNTIKFTRQNPQCWVKLLSFNIILQQRWLNISYFTYTQVQNVMIIRYYCHYYILFLLASLLLQWLANCNSRAERGSRT